MRRWIAGVVAIGCLFGGIHVLLAAPLPRRSPVGGRHYLPINFVKFPPTPTPLPTPLPPSYNNCAADPNADKAPNYPLKIIAVDKMKETVTLENQDTSFALPLDGFRICSVTGSQLHARLDGYVLGSKQRITVPAQTDTAIWSNSRRDDAALYDANGSLVSYLVDK